MKDAHRVVLLALSAALTVAACAPSTTHVSSERDGLVGAWRSQIQFTSGALAEVKDLEFMYAYNAGGTMTESSNYDGAPPMPPAYGVWKQSGPGQFETRYEFFATKAPASFEEVTAGGGWLPAGRGVLTEHITLSADGKTYTSTVRYSGYDQAGALVTSGDEGSGSGTRMDF